MKPDARTISLYGALAAATLLCSESSWAQIDLTGTWSPRTSQDDEVRGAGPDPVAYMGIPLNDAARASALTYTPENVNELHRQCQPWQLHYILMGPFGFRMYPSMDRDGQIVAWNITGSIDREPMTIWIDGRKTPAPQAMPTPAGFTTGHWVGNTLVTTTTDISDGYLTRNGVPSSKQQMFTMYVTRHDNVLTITGVIQDPVYLTAPYVLSGLWTFAPEAAVQDPPDMVAACTPEEEIASLGTTTAPVYLTPQENKNLMFETERYGIPHSTALGGEATMDPNYAKTLQGYKQPSAYCSYQCCGGQGPNGENALVFDSTVLKCHIGM